MDFDKQIFDDFIKKFKGMFLEMLPDETPLYYYKDKAYFLNEDDTEQLIKKSLEDNKNYLLSNMQFVPNPDAIY